MRFYAEYRKIVGESDSGTTADEVEADFLEAIIGMLDWTEVVGEDFDVIVERMAEQLPDNDINRFLDSVRYAFWSRTFDAGLTASIIDEPLGQSDRSGKRVVYLRVRIYLDDSRKEAELPTIGLVVANTLLRKLPTMTQTGMKIWQDRGHIPVLDGGVRHKKTLTQTVRENPAAASLLLISGCLLILLLVMAVAADPVDPSSGPAQLLGSDIVDWFKRLVGPLSSTLVASGVTVLVIYGQARQSTAYWKVEDEGSA